MNNYMMTADEVANELGVSRNFAYKIIRELNMELKSQGYVVVSGKIPRAFWKTKFYTSKEEVHGR